MVTVADATIAGAARQAIKRMSTVVVVVGEYPITELCIRVAIQNNAAHIETWNNS